VKARFIFTVRLAQPADVPALLEMKRKLQAAENAEFALRATEADWLRDGFGPQAKFKAFVAEAIKPLGMLTCSERYWTGWAGSSLYLQDLYVDPEFRGQGVAKRLVAAAASYALDHNIHFMEVAVRKDNPARRLYKSLDFEQVPNFVAMIANIRTLSILAGLSHRAAPSADD
jgi:ribosomal protein S18 acetylase RimI-like enzyme